jgi:hypothetical protein
MSKVPVPHVASADELRITQDGDHAILALADTSLRTPQIEIDAAKLAAMRAADLVAYWNDHVRTEEPAAATSTTAGPALRAGASITAAPALRSDAEVEPAVAAAEPAPVVRIAKVVKVVPDPPGKRVNKSEFVRGLPSTIPAADVVERARAAGIELSVALVYTIRANAKKAMRKSDAPSAPPSERPISEAAPKLSRPAPPSRVVALPLASTARRPALEQRFQALALEIGLAHAEALLRRVRAAAQRLIE